MSFFYLFLVGILIGTAMIIPGVSGAVIAVIFGVYDKMIKSLTNLFKDFKNNFMFLFILGLGILMGAIWFSNVLMFLYQKHEVITKFSFIGLILGGVPFLFKEIKSKNNKINYVAMALTFILSFILWIFSKTMLQLDLDNISSSYIINFFKLFLAGVIYSIGKVIPGISGSFLLIVIGMYEYVLSVIAHPITIGLTQITRLIPFIAGLVFGVLVLLKLINFLLEKHYGLTYSIIVGFILGSIPVLIPNLLFCKDTFIGVFTMILSFILSYKLIKQD